MSKRLNFNNPYDISIETIEQDNLFKNEKEKSYQNEINEFISPKRELNWRHLLQNSFHFKQDIERVWLILRSFDLLSFLSYPNHYPCVFIKGEDTWKVGNEFKGNFFGVYPFVARVNENINLPEIKKIEWLFNKNINEYFSIGMELLKVSEDNSTIVIKEIKYERELFKNENERVVQKILENTVFEEVEKILEREPINLMKYESAIINGKMEDIWNFITDFNKLTVIAPNNNYLPNICFKNMKIGEKMEATTFFNDKIKKFDITLKCKNEKPGWNKWIIVCEISGGSPTKVAKHSVFIQLTKISSNESQLTFITKFEEPISTKEFKELSNKKKYVLLSIKDYFNNFYSSEEIK